MQNKELIGPHGHFKIGDWMYDIKAGRIFQLTEKSGLLNRTYWNSCKDDFRHATENELNEVKKMYTVYLNNELYGSGDLNHVHELFKDYFITMDMYGNEEAEFKVVRKGLFK